MTWRAIDAAVGNRIVLLQPRVLVQLGILPGRWEVARCASAGELVMHRFGRSVRVGVSDAMALANGAPEAARQAAQRAYEHAFDDLERVTLNVLARRCGLSIRYVQRDAQRGRLPVAYDERGYRFVRPVDARAWVKAHRCPVAQENPKPTA